MQSRMTAVTLAAVAFALLTSAASAQQDPDAWRWQIGTGAVLGDLEGTMVVRGVDLPFDMDVSDVLGMATLLNLNGSATRGKDAFTFNFTYLKLQDTVPVGPSDAEVEVDFAQGMYELGYMRDLWRGPLDPDKPGSFVDLQGGVGARVTTMKLDLEAHHTALELDASRSEAWVEPFVAFQGMATLAPKLLFMVKADYGGFGIGNASQFTWHVTPGLVWLFDQHTNAFLGYSWTGLKNDEIDQANNTIDYTSQGVAFGVNYGF